MTDWRALIDQQVELHNRLIELGYYDDPAEIGSPASEDQIVAAEKRLDARIDSGFRSFLTVANGWRQQQDFWNLMGTEELGIGAIYDGPGPRETRTRSIAPWDGIMNVRDAGWAIGTGIETRPAELNDWRYLIPIGVTDGLGGDLYMIATPLDQPRSEPGPIYDTTYDLVRYPSFAAYLAASIERDRDHIERLTNHQ